MARVMLIYGTRPEAVKMAPLVSRLRRSADVDPVVVVTGQHRTMLDEINAFFDIVPDHDLDLMRDRQELSELAGHALLALERHLRREAPAAVVVQGDTTTALAGALATFHARIPLVHLEAGLRVPGPGAPFPEETNRRLIGRLARLHLAPTVACRNNLLAEDVPPDDIAVVGNTVVDALLIAVRHTAPFRDPLLEDVTAHRQVVVVTMHRRESWGERMAQVMAAVRELARSRPAVHVVFPVHRNPVVRDLVVPTLGDLPNVHLVDPLPYGEFVRLISRSFVVLTDSGGIQEEAPALGKPVLVLRDSTERIEAVRAGVAQVVGTGSDSILGHCLSLLDNPVRYRSMARRRSPFGDGRAAARSAAAIAELLGVGVRLPDFRGDDPDAQKDNSPVAPPRRVTSAGRV
ncbi:UDP-N-acetylglucosamine 2-epimerase (non-hydrolyzing) [Streptomyces sp. NPDC006385]|uniref:non-hydrolyzing UDP-N-acetylglucosamine 2-epimerase n=1 Tax=Streptomyces sp. NPDC006385 TaxID=3156761 RepID=UPI0033B6D2B1